MPLGASAYLARAPLAGPTFSAAAKVNATLAFTSLQIPEDSPSGARAAATAIASAARRFAVGVDEADRGCTGADRIGVVGSRDPVD